MGGEGSRRNLATYTPGGGSVGVTVGVVIGRVTVTVAVAVAVVIGRASVPVGEALAKRVGAASVASGAKVWDRKVGGGGKVGRATTAGLPTSMLRIPKPLASTMLATHNKHATATKPVTKMGVEPSPRGGGAMIVAGWGMNGALGALAGYGSA
jgi:hypothetical protein